MLNSQLESYLNSTDIDDKTEGQDEKVANHLIPDVMKLGPIRS